MLTRRAHSLGAVLLSLALVLGVAAPASAEPELLDTLTAEDRPRFVAVSPDGSRLYVSNTNANSVTVFDTVSRQAVGSVAVTTPHQLAVSPDGNTLYVANFTGQLRVVDVTTDSPTLAATIALGIAGVRGLVVTPDGQKVYVAGRESSALGFRGTVVVLTTSSNSVANLGAFTSGADTLISGDQIVVSPDGQYVYVSFSKRDGSTLPSPVAGLARIQVATNAIESVAGAAVVGVQPSGLALSSDGRYLYVADTAGSASAPGLRKYDLSSAAGTWLGTPLSTLNVAAPELIALSADDTTLFVSALGSNTPLRIVDTASNSVTSEILLPERIAGVTAHPARNTRYAFVGSWSAGGDVYVVGTEAVVDAGPDGAAPAGDVPPTAIGLALEATVGAPVVGKPVNFTVQKMAPGSSFTLSVEPGGMVLAQGVLGPGGNAAGTPPLPALTPGAYSVVLVAQGPDGATYRLEQSFVVGEDLSLASIAEPVGSITGGAVQTTAPSATPERLAYTGVTSTELPLWALVFFGVGLVLVVYSVRARRLVEALVAAEATPTERTPWEILATPIRVPGLNYVPGSQSQPTIPAPSLAETILELDIALSRLVVRNLDKFSLRLGRDY